MRSEAAFLYKNRYYLIPDIFDDFDGFDEFLKLNSDSLPLSFETFELVEHMCLAPYFVDDYIEKTDVTIDGRIYPFTACLMPMDEYNTHLRKVIRQNCDGCIRYTKIDDTDKSLDGHHDEITLDGVCFERVEDEYEYTFQYGIDEFIDDFNMVKGYIEKLVDEDKTKKAAYEICDLIRSDVMPPPGFALTTKANGKYLCVFSGLSNPCSTFLLSEFCNRAANQMGGDWVFVPYIPRGILTLKGIALPLPDFEVRVNSDYMTFVELLLERDKYTDNAYMALCDEIGEDNYIRALRPRLVDSIQHNSTVRELSCAVDFFLEHCDSKHIFPPEVMFASMAGNDELTIHFSTIGNIPQIIYDQPEKLVQLREFYGLGISFAVIEFDTDASDSETADEIIRAVFNKVSLDDCVLVCRTCGRTSSKLLLMMFDKRSTMAALRSLAPMFEGCNAALNVVSYDNAPQKYKLNFKMERIY